MLIKFMNQILCISEIVIMITFLIDTLNWKDKKSNLPYAVITGMLIWGTEQMNGRFAGSYIVSVAAFFLLLFLFAYIFLKGSWQMKCMVCLFPFFIDTVINVILMQISALVRKIPVGEYLKLGDHYFMIAPPLSKMMLGIALYMVWRILKREGLQLPEQYYHLINIQLFLTIVIEYILFSVINKRVYDTAANGMLTMASIVIGIISFYMIELIFAINRKNREVLMYKMAAVQNKEQKKQLELFGQSAQKMRQLRHDYKNHMDNIRRMAESQDNDKIKRYVEELQGAYQRKSTEHICTGSEILDATLNNKMDIADEEGIRIFCEIIGNVSSINDVEYAIILFNLLDNAIEACEKVTEGDREITIYMEMLQEEWNLIIGNTIEKSVLENNRELHSDKKNSEEHGIGHVTIKELVEKRDGIVEYYEKNGRFYAHVIMRVQ